MNKITIIGHFGGDKKFSDGQTVKTKELYNHIASKVSSEIIIFDTYRITKNIFKLIGMVYKSLKSSDKIILIVSSRGYKILLPIIIVLNQIYNRDIYDFVIGGYRQNHLRKNKILRLLAKKCKMIYLESNKLVEKYKSLGIMNCRYLPNFKKLNLISEECTCREVDTPLRVCTFSRICKEKGIEDAIEAVKMVNSKYDKVIYQLDIFGIPDKAYINRFEELKEKFPSYINYRGLVDYSKSTDVLKKYFLLLFPTYHNGEGFPGTLIDSFSSGLPVIASEWNCNVEIIEDGVTGRIVPIKDPLKLSELLVYYAEHPMEVIKMRLDCVNEAKKYTPAYALKSFIEELRCS